MPNKKLIFKKLEEILKQLGHLKILAKIKEKQLVGDARNFYFAERVMERLIGAALDINMHMVADLTGEVPENYFDSFTALAKLNILPPSFAQL
ncbi:MAG: HepT-like ribonuclease domain-containing protein [Patescibacteria group bacterium]